MSDENKTGMAALVGLGVIGAVTLATHFLGKSAAFGAVSLSYWRDGLPVRVGDHFRRDPIYSDFGIYKVIEVSPDTVRFRGEEYPHGTIRAWGSDFFNENGIASDGLGPNQGIWTRVRPAT